ncbi:hypothetical protein PENANT_c012G05689 [Penicillium antarcticum]|uniref:Uncharacterized protein n=1 Tax=Penicillium antarcticum TaxID=416450 RepID=A0A1V6Q635_9EURO|nr:uncharacterized protein N7508_008011 [Penicillium antarcticum]KAJ5297762.1 hypothetical protein N7508_008011 [Penicillium antarcticum]OQD84694.1 hypothetical protein PENANT_c012G05689 [Penicillium antarcticum]
MPTVIGNSTPWKQISESRTSELRDRQEICYQTAVIWARVTGEKTLDDSVHAPTPNWQLESKWQVTYESYVSDLASSRTEMFHRSAVSHDKTAPLAASLHASGHYKKATAAATADPTDSPGYDNESGKTDEINTLGSTNDTGIRPVASAKDFMNSFRALRVAEAAAAAAAEPGPPRRLLFKNLPEWATISHVLHLVWGGTIERAWSETSGEVNVQFTDADDCNRYFEQYSEGISIKVGDDGTQIFIELMDNDIEHPDLASRISADASRLVCLSGLATSLVGQNDEPILGIASQPEWENKELEQILIEYGTDVSLPPSVDSIDVEILTDSMKGTLNIHVSFFNLHDAWDFYQDIKEGTYDCISKFEADP